MRRGASILAAVAVVGGGVFVAGAGTAGAVGVVDVCGGCDMNPNWGQVIEKHANFEVRHSGPPVAAPGDTASFTVEINNLGDTTRNGTKIVHHPPAGLVLSEVPRASVSNGPLVPIQVEAQVDPVSGAVTVTAAPGQQADLGNAIVTFTYEVEGPVFLGGANGVTFEATGVPESARWLAMGYTRPALLPGEGGGFGSFAS